MKRRIYLLCTSLALSIWAIGQVQVRGTVQSDEGRPLEGATVTIKGTKIATIANSEGVFVIEVPSSSSTLVISSVGFLTTEQPASSNVMDIILRKDDRRLSEVVVVGYGQ
ncbi:MAG TPA: carboxypeptidase-like regulatory domain-containing protein, partial [Chitinophagaceae bacterium]|nr:carboxypeptidase-like regulatory domain-containing protein [Chitinophagaceae bacterium]